MTERRTRQGDAILRVLRAEAGFRSAQDIHAMLRGEGDSVGLTTVYRHLQQLADAGVLDTVQVDSSETAYRLCLSDVHHHHIVCRRCGRSEEVEAPEVEAWAEDVARRLGYEEVSHALDIFGICSTCRDGEGATGRWAPRH